MTCNPSLVGIEWQNFAFRHRKLRPTAVAMFIHELTKRGTGTCLYGVDTPCCRGHPFCTWEWDEEGGGWVKKDYVQALKAKNRSSMRFFRAKPKWSVKTWFHSEMLAFLFSENIRISQQMKTYQRSDWDACFFLALCLVPLGIRLASPSCFVGLFVTLAPAVAEGACLPYLLLSWLPYVGQSMFSRASGLLGM